MTGHNDDDYGPNADPKKIAGDKKLVLTNLPMMGIALEADCINTGAVKYGKYNWTKKDRPVAMLTYCNAVLRHAYLLIAGQDCASDSGKHHAAHIIAGMQVLQDAIFHDNCLDDRMKMPAKQLAEFEKLLNGDK